MRYGSLIAGDSYVPAFGTVFRTNLVRLPYLLSTCTVLYIISLLMEKQNSVVYRSERCHRGRLDPRVHSVLRSAHNAGGGAT